MIIRRLSTICAAAALGMFAVPLAAQQMPPDQTTVPGQPQTPSDQSPMPPEPQTTPDLPPPPPPFPPMPRAKPTHRWVSVDWPNHGYRHHRNHVHNRHDAHHRRGHRPTRHRGGRTTTKTIRWCGHMSDRAMMRHRACRALLGAEQQHRAGRHHHAVAGHRLRHDHGARFHHHRSRHRDRARRHRR